MERKKASDSIMESYKLKDKTIKLIDEVIRGTYGISLQEYNELDFDDQQELVRKYHKKHKQKKSKEVTVMVGSGEHATFTTVKKGEKVMIGSGENSCFVEAGVTPEESSEKLEYELDKVIYGKTKALLKKIQRNYFRK